MGIKDKLMNVKKKLGNQYKKGKEVTEQQRAEKLRQKRKKLTNMKPGASKAIKEGLMLRSGPMEVMKKEYDRRKYERQIKQQKKNR